jgi:hypothetical protein
MVTVASRKRVFWIIDHNPFYLLSALSMLFGCYALNHVMNVQAGELWKLIALLATTNLYELLLVALGVLLYARLGLVRDAVFVLMTELLFLADATFLNGETATTDLQLGGAINLFLVVLAVLKVWVLLRALKVPAGGRVLTFIALQLAVLYMIPGFFRKIGPDGTVSALGIYAVWWIVGVLPFLLEVILGRSITRPAASGIGSAFVKAYIIVPYLSLLAHLWIMHWVYEAPFYWADLTPVVLGLTLVSRKVRPSAIASARDLFIMRAFLPVAAVLFSLDHPLQLQLHVGAHVVTPVMLSLFAAYLTCVYCFMARHRLVALAAGSIAGLAWALREAISRMLESATGQSELAASWFAGIIPQTVEAWGLIAIIGAFVLLALAAGVSLSKFSAEKPPG